MILVQTQIQLHASWPTFAYWRNRIIEMFVLFICSLFFLRSLLNKVGRNSRNGPTVHFFIEYHESASMQFFNNHYIKSVSRYKEHWYLSCVFIPRNWHAIFCSTVHPAICFQLHTHGCRFRIYDHTDIIQQNCHLLSSDCFLWSHVFNP